MRILHIDTERGFRGGERQLMLLGQGLREQGVEQLFAGPIGSEYTRRLLSDGFAVAEWKRPLLLAMRSPALRRWLRRVASDFDADLIHAHTGNAHTLAVNSFLGTLPIVTTRRVDFAIKNNPASRRKYTSPGQHFVAISNRIRDVLIAGGVLPDNITLVPSGIDTNRVKGGNGETLRAEWLAGGSGPVIGFVGALVDHKAPWILAEAAGLIREHLPEAKIVFVGDGEERSRIQQIQEKSPEAIHLAGWRDDIADCLAAMDVFVMPSKLEGLCTSLIDSLAAGVPSVASNAGGIPDVIIHEETGLLVPAMDAEKLADSVVRLWNDQTLREKFIENGRAHVEANFTAAAMVRGTRSVYDRLLGRKR